MGSAVHAPGQAPVFYSDTQWYALSQFQATCRHCGPNLPWAVAETHDALALDFLHLSCHLSSDETRKPLILLSLESSTRSFPKQEIPSLLIRQRAVSSLCGRLSRDDVEVRMRDRLASRTTWLNQLLNCFRNGNMT